MKRPTLAKQVSYLASGLAVFAGIMGGANAAPKKSAAPNIVVILADDMGWSDLGCYGSEISTPNLDKLAQEGVRFTQFYNTARCSPSRASLMTGLYPHEAGMGYLDDLVHPNSLGTQGRLNDRAVTIAQVLKPQGYFTAMAGKWHMGQAQGTAPWNKGFDRSLDSAVGGIYFPDQKGGKPLYLDSKEMPLDSPAFGKEWYSSNLWTDYGMRFIDQSLQEKKPFFLYLPFCAPHFPLMAPAKDIAKYRGKYLAGWDKLREDRHKRQIQMGLVDPKWLLAPRPKDSPAWNTLSEADKKMFDNKMAVYAAMIDNLDQNVGRLVADLKKKGVYDNTLILFMSDNGGNAESGPRGITEGEVLGSSQSRVFLGMNWATLANTPFRRYKHFTHEGGISAPFIAHWPNGINKARDGKLEKQPAHLVDIMPTILQMTGAKYPQTFNGHAILPMEGVSLLPALAGKSLNRTKPIYWEHEGNRAIRSGKWMLVSKFKEPWELYDIEADRTEQHDVAAQHTQLVSDMTASWEAWSKRAFVDQWQGRHRNDWGEEDPAPEGEVGSKDLVFNLKMGDNLKRDEAPMIVGRAIHVTAQLGAEHGNGVIIAQGGSTVGYALYVRDNHLELATRLGGEQIVVTAPDVLPTGPIQVEALLTKEGAYTLKVVGQTVATGKGAHSIQTMPQDGLQVGLDRNGLVGRYEEANNFAGTIESVKIELAG